MSLQNSPAIKQGWVRALLLFILFIGISTGAGLFLHSLQEWIGIVFLIAFALVYLFRRFVDRKQFSSIGFDFHHILPDALTGTALATFLICAGTLIIYFFGAISWIDIVANANSLLTDLVLMIMVAISEELVFRGYVLRNLSQSMNKWIAVPISALLFTMVHVTNPDIPVIALVNTFLGGLLLGITFIQTASLWLPIFFHFTWNYLQGPLLGYKVSGIEFRPLLVSQTKGNEFMNGGEYGYEGSVIATVMLLIAVLFYFFFYRKSPAATG